MKKLLITSLMFVFSLTMIGCQESGLTTEAPHQLSNNIRSFSNQGELEEYFETMEIEMTNRNLFSITDGALTPEASMEDSNQSKDSHSETNVQVEGVAEIDSIITDGQFIYIAKNNSLRIVDVESMSVVFEEVIEGGYYSGLYLYNNKLVAIYSQYQQITQEEESTEYYYWWWWGSNNLMIDVYDVSDMDDVNVVRSLEFKDTSLTDSRIIDGQMYLVMYNYLYSMNDEIPVPEYSDSFVNE